MTREGRAGWIALAVGFATAGSALLFFLSFDSPWALRGENKISLFPMNADTWRQWRSGHFPLWTSGMFGGFPLFAGSQSSALYLPHALAFLLTPAPHWRALDVALALHAGLLTSGCVRLLLHFGLRPISAIFGAVLVLFAPNVVYWTSFAPMYVAIAWWPWIFLAADRLSNPDARRLGPIVLGAVALAAQIFVGYVEYALYSGCSAAGWILVNAKQMPVVTRVAHVAALGVSGALLAAPQLLPTALDLGESARSAREYLPLGLVAESLTGLVDPREGGRNDVIPSAFLGGATLALAACAVALRVRRSVFLAGLAVLCGLLSLGSATPLYGWLTSLPVFELFRTPLKFYVMSNIGVAFLAALGLDALLSRASRRVVVAAVVLAAIAVAEYGMHLSLELPVVARSHIRTETGIPKGLAGFEAFLPELLPEDRDPGPPPRVLHVGWPASFGSLGEVYGVESILGQSPALLAERQARLLRRSIMIGVSWIDRDWADLLGIQLIAIRGKCRRFQGRQLEIIAVEHGDCLLRNPRWPERFELLSEAAPVDDLSSELERVLEQPGAPFPVVVTQTGEETDPVGPATAWREAGPLAADEGVEVLAYRPGAIRLRVRSERDRLLLVREARHQGWHVQVDGNAAPILPAAGLFFAVPISKGEHVVEIAYEARGLATGFALASAWLIAVAALWVASVRAR